MSGIGHNSGHQLGRGWQKYCWTRSRRALVGKRLPVEVVRTRIKRARQLGLAYPQYASILLGSGRDIVGFLFTVDGLQLRLQQRLDMPDHVRDKLQGLSQCDLMAFAPSGENPAMFRAEVSNISGVNFTSAAPEAKGFESWSGMRDAVKSALEPVEIPSRGVVMIGHGSCEPLLASAGNLAKFLPSEAYFQEAMPS